MDHDFTGWRGTGSFGVEGCRGVVGFNDSTTNLLYRPFYATDSLKEYNNYLS